MRVQIELSSPFTFCGICMAVVVALLVLYDGFVDEFCLVALYKLFIMLQ